MSTSTSPISAAETAPSLDVLLVDDNIEVVESLAQFLESVGFRAKAVSSPREALVLVRSIERIGVVVLDYCMPVTDGLELAQEIRQIRHEEDAVELILLTAHANTELVFKAVKGEFFGFHEKPCRPRILAETIRKALISAERRRLAVLESHPLCRTHPSAGTEAAWAPDAILSATKARQYLNATKAGLRLSAIGGLTDRRVRQPGEIINVLSQILSDAIDLLSEGSTLFISAHEKAGAVIFAVDSGKSEHPESIASNPSPTFIEATEPPSALRAAARQLADIGVSLIIEHREGGPNGRYAVSFSVPTLGS